VSVRTVNGRDLSHMTVAAFQAELGTFSGAA
jgi:hypothetical protein